jgi:hypothetical protein
LVGGVKKGQHFDTMKLQSIEVGFFPIFCKFSPTLKFTFRHTR